MKGVRLEGTAGGSFSPIFLIKQGSLEHVAGYYVQDLISSEKGLGDPARPCTSYKP